jgi:hypothetical protein
MVPKKLAGVPKRLAGVPEKLALQSEKRGSRLAVNTLLELFPGLEERQFLGADGYFFTGFRVAPHVAFVLLDKKAA